MYLETVTGKVVNVIEPSLNRKFGNNLKSINKLIVY